MESEVHLRPAVPEATTEDEPAIKEVISKVKSQGLFDQFRKECIADVDTKPAYHNLLQRVESYVEHFLQGQKWSLSANKNQLRETLRRRLHNSGMMQNGVERIIEQVVNPKILLGIKPKIDEAVCDHLGIDLKARQEEQQRRRQEQQKLLLQQMQQQQQHVQSLQSQNVKNGEPVFPPSGSTPSAGPNPWVNPAMVNYPSSSIPGVGAPAPGVPGANPQTMGGNFPGMVPPFPLMPGWMPGFNPGGGMAPMMPGQPMIPAFPGAPGVVSPAAGMGPRPPFNASSAAGVVTPSASTTTGSITTSPRAGHSLSTSTPVVGGQMQVPNLSQPPPVLPSASNVVTNRIGASPIISPMVPPGTSPLAPPGTSPLAPPGTSPLVPPGTSPVVIPGTSRVAPAPHGSIPPPPGTVPVSENAKSNPLQGTPHIPALLSHTLAKVSEDELTPEKIAVFKTAAAFITKTVNNAGGAAAGDLASILSPRVLAEAMMKDCGKPMTKAEIRAVKRKERYKEMERLRAEREEKEAIENENQVKTLAEGDDDKENPLPPPKHNLMDVFQGAEDVSDDEEALDMLMDVEEPTEETEDKNKQGIVLSDEEDLDDNVEKPPTSQPGKRYNFTWDVNLNSGDMSDVTVSSVHTSDMSSFEEDDEEENDMFSDIVSEEEKMKESTPEKAVDEDSQKVDIEDEVQSVKMEGLSPAHVPDTDDVVEEAISADVTNTPDESEIDIKVEKDLELDNSKTEKSEDTEEIETVIDETVVEEKKAVVEQPEESVSVVSPDVKTEPVQTAIDVTQTEGGELSSKPRKLLALSYHYSDSDDEETREERKARIAKEKEERYLKRQQRRAELDAKKKERDEEKARVKREKQMQKEKGPVETEDKTCSATDTSQTDAQTAANTSIEVESSSQNTPRKRKNKAEMKEQLLQQKVMEKKAALRRKRTRNRRYASDEFTSIFSDHKKLNQSYTDGVNQEEIVTFEGDGALEIVEMTVDMTVDQECIVETVGEEIETSEGGKDLVLQCPSPYSDISDRSMSEKSEPENITDDDDDPGVDQVSSDDELGDLEEVKIVEEIEESSSKGHMSPSQSASESDVGQILSEAAMTPDASRMSSARSKSMSQDEIESVFSGHSIDKRKPSGTSLSQDDDIESQTSQLEISAKSSIKSISDTVESEIKASKIDDVTDTTATTDSPAKDIMGELELEPVSDEDSLGGLDDEEDEGDDRKVAEADEKVKEEKESDKESLSISHPHIKVERKSSSDSRKFGKADTENASDEGEIKSESEKEEEKEREDDEDLEEKRRRAAIRKPIHQVDFGEAARRARVQRGIFNISGDSQDWRGGRPVGMNNPSTPNYRGGFNTWTPAGASSIPQFGPPKSGSRFMGHESMSPIRAKSPGAFDAESENSSHSRSSVRVRDDIPPPYPIEGVNMGRKHRSPASSSDNAVDYKPLSPPSPVSSTSSRSHSRSRSRSRSRSSSPALSRTSSLSSLSAASSSRKPKRLKRSKRKKRKKERQRRTTSRSPRPSPVRLPSEERRISPRNSPDLHNPAITHPVRNIHSGNESISSDELPNFSDDEIEQKNIHTRSGSFSSGSSSVGLSKRLKKDSPGSISSSELIYSPTRTKLASGDESNNSYSSSGSSKRIKRRKRRRSSSVKSDQSSDLPPVSPIRESPHGPSSPISFPPLPADMSGFQPPLPEEPMPIDLPPLPPQPPSPPPIQRNRPSISEEEEGECPSTPEQPHSPDNDGDDSRTQIPPSYDNDKLRHSQSQNNSESSSQYGQSKSDIEQTDLVCVSKKKDLNSDVNENFPPSADTSSSLSQDTVTSPSNAISRTQVLEEATVDKNETFDRVETDKQNSPLLQKTEEKMQPSEIHCVNTEMLVTEEAKSAPSLPQSPPPPVPPSTPPSSPPPSPPAAALNDTTVTVTEESTKDIPTLDAPSNPDLCSFESADSSISSQQSPTHKSHNIITSSSSGIDITHVQSNTTDSQNPDDGATDSNLSSEEATGASSLQENEQSRKRSAQDDDDDDSASKLANEHSTKKQKLADD